MKIAITGHRPNKLNNEYDGIGPLSDKIRKELQKIIDFYRPNLLISGMALGVDMLWAELAIKNNINLLCAVPCWNQEVIWPESSQQRYKDIINNKLSCLKFVTDGYYTIDCMQKRNEFMVDECNKLVAVWDGSKGGTANCYNYAIHKVKHNRLSIQDIIVINPRKLE